MLCERVETLKSCLFYFPLFVQYPGNFHTYYRSVLKFLDHEDRALIVTRKILTLINVIGDDAASSFTASKFFGQSCYWLLLLFVVALSSWSQGS